MAGWATILGGQGRFGKSGGELASVSGVQPRRKRAGSNGFGRWYLEAPLTQHFKEAMMARPRTSAVNKDDLKPEPPAETDEQFDQGHGDGNQIDGTPEGTEDITRPDAAQTTISDDAQGAFGDVILNVEEGDGVKGAESL